MMPRLHPDQLQHTFWGGSPDKLFPKADQVVPMCSQDCSKLLTLVASAPSEGPWGRSTKSVSMVYSVATVPEIKGQGSAHWFLPERWTDDSPEWWWWWCGRWTGGLVGWGGVCQSSLCLLGPTARHLPRWLPELPEETKERGCHLVEESDRTAHWLSAWWIPGDV